MKGLFTFFSFLIYVFLWLLPSVSETLLFSPRVRTLSYAIGLLLGNIFVSHLCYLPLIKTNYLITNTNLLFFLGGGGRAAFCFGFILYVGRFACFQHCTAFLTAWIEQPDVCTSTCSTLAFILYNFYMKFMSPPFLTPSLSTQCHGDTPGPSAGTSSSFILTRCSRLGSVKLTCSHQSADCATDHSLLCSKVKLQSRCHYSKKENRPRINTGKNGNHEKVEEYTWALECLAYPVQMSVRDETIWPCLHSARDKSADWFKAYSKKTLPIIEEKRRALATYKSSSNVKNLQALQTALSKVQKTVKSCANDYWLKLSADTGNVKGGQIPIHQLPFCQSCDLAEGADALYTADQMVLFYKLLQFCVFPDRQCHAWCECCVCERININIFM